MRPRRLLLLLLTALLLAGIPAAHGEAEQTDAARAAEAMLATMTPAERVGQLFLVTIDGPDLAPDGEVANFIRQYHIGGVALLRENDNFGPGDVTERAQRLIDDLQRVALGLAPAAPEEPPAFLPATSDDLLTPPAPTATLLPPEGRIPLFIAMSHEGGGPPDADILSGLTPLPSAMSLGATWQPEYARDIGAITGAELAGLGVNLLLGPTLDVVERPLPVTQSELGTRVFGGDPYWVGQLGRAYVAGVHEGSSGRIAVVATHFPGNGSSDRPIDQEISTVRKSLEQLKQIELAPFFAVTGASGQSPAQTTGVVDGLLTTHIRFQGFQGNIRATTAPISFDFQALTTLMQLPEFVGWRQNGGLLVSDRLGVRAVQRFYDDTGQTFPQRRIAKDALLAGNDLLYLAQFALGDAPYEDQLANMRDTISWFEERYTTDPTFQQRVDQAVARILATKWRLYGGDFSPAQVLGQGTSPALPDEAVQAVLFDQAEQAVSLISPGQEELSARLPAGPGETDSVVVFTDVRPFQQCSECSPQPALAETDLADHMLALYGPSGSGQVRSGQIQSFSFEALSAFLDAGPDPIAPPGPAPTAEAEDLPPPTPAPPSPAYLVQQALRGANWILFAMLDVRADLPSSAALNRFLALRSDLVRERNVVVFAFAAPYYLDTTEISKITAYYGVYSRTAPALDAALQVLFKDIPAAGRPPVSIEGVGYDLYNITQPTPDQVLELFIVTAGTPQAPLSNEPLELVVGDALRLQTGVIVDQNGNPVPDGTLVQFTQLDRINGLTNVLAERPTVAGVASLDYVLEARTGQFRITASAGPAIASQEVDIVIGDNVRIVVITPTPAPTPTPSPEPTPSPNLEPTGTASPTAPATLAPAGDDGGSSLEIPVANLLLLVTMLIGVVLIIAFALLLGTLRGVTPTQLARLALWGLVGGLAAYAYLALGLPGLGRLAPLGTWSGLVVTLVGGGVGLALAGRRALDPPPLRG